jgi:hypothetical protein
MEMMNLWPQTEVAVASGDCMCFLSGATNPIEAQGRARNVFLARSFARVRNEPTLPHGTNGVTKWRR